MCTQMEAVSHATRLAIVHESAEPWRTPQRKFVVAVPNGVVVVVGVVILLSRVYLGF